MQSNNYVLVPQYKYKEVFERTKSNFKYVADCPINRHFKYATQLMNEVGTTKWINKPISVLLRNL